MWSFRNVNSWESSALSHKNDYFEINSTIYRLHYDLYRLLKAKTVIEISHTHTQNEISAYKEKSAEDKVSLSRVTKDVSIRVLLFAVKVVPSLPGCFRTPTGTMTVGGGELSTPEAWACCRGGMVEQYSAGLLGFGLWLLAAAGVSHDWADREKMAPVNIRSRHALHKYTYIFHTRRILGEFRRLSCKQVLLHSTKFTGVTIFSNEACKSSLQP